MEFSHYQQLPAHLANEVIQESQEEE